jgi:HEAT repeat protein
VDRLDAALRRLALIVGAAVAALVEALKDEDEGVRNSAAQSLTTIGPEVKKAGVK